ncbi:F-box domain-containing protein [Mycena sanguinolenta]|uniref:F-box domain-containing protein n=1 Tax=Mycena sanguinolenta TaxID=230812 RepID=A0A8H6YML6_9AGAR|nr:F-box domain-containing protein [Mycena sanguinolenta]
MSVEDFRARIMQLDIEIDLQKELLKKLEYDRSLVRRQLNAALDPVARLPLEISSEIFLQGGRQAPAVLMGICHAWTEIALATPKLWTTIRINFPCAEDLAEVLPVWFQRARNRPLSITISLCGHSSNWNHRVSSVIWRHGQQLKHLEILDDDDFGDESEESLDLGATNSMSLPLLETLTMRCERQQRDYLVSHIIDLLRQAPNIVKCIFDNIRTLDHLPDSDHLIAPSLRGMIFGDRHTGEPDILHRLSLPALETLVIPISSIFNEEHLLALIQRSAPPLQHLALGWGFYFTDSFHLLECLHIVPSLVRFEMWMADPRAVNALFAALANSPSLLPNLRNLTIHLASGGDEPNISDSWRMLLRALSTRRVMGLEILPVTMPPPTDVLASLRELVTAGVEIYIGDDERNLVVA